MPFPKGQSNVARLRRPLIIDDVVEWWCTGCTRWLPGPCFYGDKRQKSGLSTNCRRCHVKLAHLTCDKALKNERNREYMRLARLADPEKFRARDRRRRPRGQTRKKAPSCAR